MSPRLATSTTGISVLGIDRPMRTKIVALTLASLQGEDGAVILPPGAPRGTGEGSRRAGDPSTHQRIRSVVLRWELCRRVFS